MARYKSYDILCQTPTLVIKTDDAPENQGEGWLETQKKDRAGEDRYRLNTIPCAIPVPDELYAAVTGGSASGEEQ